MGRGGIRSSSSGAARMQRLEHTLQREATFQRTPLPRLNRLIYVRLGGIVSSRAEAHSQRLRMDAVGRPAAMVYECPVKTLACLAKLVQDSRS